MDFLQKVSALRLPFLASNPVKTTVKGDCQPILSFGMKAKKRHEVDLFSEHVNHLTSEKNIKQVCKVLCYYYVTGTFLMFQYL